MGRGGSIRTIVFALLLPHCSSPQARISATIAHHLIDAEPKAHPNPCVGILGPGRPLRQPRSTPTPNWSLWCSPGVLHTPILQDCPQSRPKVMAHARSLSRSAHTLHNSFRGHHSPSGLTNTTNSRCGLCAGGRQHGLLCRALGQVVGVVGRNALYGVGLSVGLGTLCRTPIPLHLSAPILCGPTATMAGTAKQIFGPPVEILNSQFSILNYYRYLCANYGTKRV